MLRRPGASLCIRFAVAVAAAALATGDLGASFNSNLFVGVPIPPPNQPEPVPLVSAGGYALNVIDIEGEVAPADLAVLKRYPPFDSLSDAQIVAKMNVMRRNVIRAIQLIAYEDGDLSYCLSRLWHQRRLCIAFTNQGIGGITNANRFPGAADKCERAAIAIHIDRIPCDPRRAYDGDMIVLANTMAHEALHVRQDWSGVLPPRLPRNAAEIDLRLQIQNNEIAASEAEKRRLRNLNIVFEFIALGRGVPEDDPRGGFEKLPITRRAVELFQRHVKPEDQRAVADDIEKKTQVAREKACLTLRCRLAVKSALETLKASGDGGAFLRDLRGSRAASGWASILGRRLFTGVFQTDIFGGGVGADTNVVRQFVSGTEHRHTLPVDFITGVFPNQANSVLVAGSDEDAASGTIFLLGDSDGDQVLDTMMPTLSHEYLAGGVTFCPTAGGLYCFSPRTQMIFQLQLGSDGTFTYPVGISFAGSVANPADSMLQHFILADDGLTGYGLVELDFANHPGTRLLKVVRPNTSTPFSPAGEYDPLADTTFPPAVARWPFDGDSSVSVSGTAGAGVTVEIVDLAGSVMAGAPATLGDDGFAEIDLPVALNSSYGVRVSDGSFASQALLTSAPILPRATPAFEGDRFRVSVQSRPGAVHKYHSAGGDLRGLQPLACIQADGFGNTSYPHPIAPPSVIGPAPERGFFSVEVDTPPGFELADDTLTVAPGVETTFFVNANDVFPHGTVFSLSSPPMQPQLHPDLLRLRPDGSLTITPPTSAKQITFGYGAAPAGGDVAATATVTIQVDAAALHSPPLADAVVPDLGRIAGFHVACLRLPQETGGDPDNGSHYPLYQFQLVDEPGGNCPAPHWDATVAHPVEGGAPLANPAPKECGFGRRSETKPVTIFVPQPDWQNFLNNHPPPP